jgi:hypothetical protein
MHPVDRSKLACHMYPILKSMRKVALLLQASPASVCRWLKHPERKQYQRCNVSKAEQIIATLRALVTTNPLATLAHMTTTVKQLHKLTVSKELVRSVLRSSGYSRKRTAGQRTC